MKNSVKKVIKLLNVIIPYKIINYAISEANIAKCLKLVTADEGVFFYKESEIINDQNDRVKIRIRKGTHIRGSLLIFGYGGKIEIGENCYVGDHTRIWSGSSIKIGDNVLISHGVNIMDTNAHEINHRMRADGYINTLKHGTNYLKGRVDTKPVVIKDNAWIGFNSIIMKGVNIGEGAIVAAGSVVTKDVEPFTMVAGSPSRFIKKLQ